MNWGGGGGGGGVYNVSWFILLAVSTHINTDFHLVFLFTGIVLKKGFPAASRSSVRKDLGLVLKKARANKENKAKCKGQETRKL